MVNASALVIPRMVAAICTVVPAQVRRTAEGRARIAAAQFKHGKRSKAFVAAQRAKNAKGKAINRELKSLEALSLISVDVMLPMAILPINGNT